VAALSHDRAVRQLSAAPPEDGRGAHGLYDALDVLIRRWPSTKWE